MKRTGFLFLILLLLVRAFNLHGQDLTAGQYTEVIIVHTNDMHARIDNMPKLAYLIDSLKKDNPYVFLVSAGDNFTGNSFVDRVKDKGSPMIDLMNRCGFNVSAIGNHEFDLGLEFLSRRMEQAVFPFISCNLEAATTTLIQPQPYVFLHAGPALRIPVLGITQLGANGLPDTHPSKVTGLRFNEGITEAKKWGWLKEKYGILIALTHLGIDDDVRLAKEMPQLDLIIGGHSHTITEKPMFQEGVMIVQAGSGLKYVGKTTLKIKDRRIISKRDELISMSDIHKADTSLQRTLEIYKKDEYLLQTIAIAEEEITGSDALGSLMTDALVFGTAADLAFQNRGGIRLPSLKAGPLRLNDIYDLDPFDNQVVLFSMNTAEIRSLICYGYGLENTIDLEVSGMTYRIRTDREGKCSNVEMTDNSGKPLEPNREYIVALSSYIAAAYKFDHRDPGKGLSMTTAEVLIEYLRKVKKVNYTGIKRTEILPLP